MTAALEGGKLVSSTARPQFTPGKDPVPILQEAGWATGPDLTGGKSPPHRDSIPDRPARSQSLYQLSYPAHQCVITELNLCLNYRFKIPIMLIYKAQVIRKKITKTHYNFRNLKHKPKVNQFLSFQALKYHKCAQVLT